MTLKRISALIFSASLVLQSNIPAWAAGDQANVDQCRQSNAASSFDLISERPTGDLIDTATNDEASSQDPIDEAQRTILLAAADIPSLTPANEEAPLKARIDATDPDTAMSRVDDLTRQIILKLIELERFNLHFKQNVSKQGRWKGWRYAVFQEANFSLNMAGNINNVGERGMHLHHANHVSTNRVEMGNAIGMIGSIIGASGAALELLINEYHDWEAATHGFSPHAARMHVLDLKGQIDKLLAERDALEQIEQKAPLLRAHVCVDVAEGKVLKDMRDLGLFEYSRFHIRQRRFMAFQQSLYFFDLAKYSTGAIGSFFAYMSLHKHRRVWNNRAGVLFDVSGALTIAAPLASRGLGILAGRFHKHMVSPVTQDIQAREISTLEADQAALEKMCSEGGCPADQLKAPVQRAAVYHLSDKGFQDELHESLQTTRKARLVATQNVESGFFVGGTKLASGVLYNVVGKRYNTKSNVSGRVTNSDLFAAGVLGTTGNGVAVLDTMRLQVQGELNRYKLAKQGKLPGQLINTRLKELDNMETMLKSSTR